jgi:competence protein ComFB
MKIHNLMEDIILEKVHEIFDEEDTDLKNKGCCTCYQCRLDVACYVLNRIQSKYMTSSRGLAHLRTEYQNNLQKAADLVSLINDGIKQISSAKRPHYAHAQEEKPPAPEGPLYNFPTIIGRLFNGKTFEPMKDITITLRQNGKPAEMIEPSWQNPYHISFKTAGTFLFWPHPIPANSPQAKKIFEFELVVEEQEEFDELHHFFAMDLEAEDDFNDSVHLQRTYKLEDMYLFPK